MKLSEMNTVEMADALVELAEPIGNIAADDAIVEKMRYLGTKKTNVEIFGAAIAELAPFLLKSHFDDTCAVVAVLADKTVDDVKNQKGLQTIADMKNCFDRELFDFFKSAVPTGQSK
jgi:hypothetical protein